MEQLYTLAEIAARVNKTQQSLYKFINKNKAFINSNCVSKGRNKFYNQAVMDRFLEYYGIPTQEQTNSNAQNDQDIPQDAPKQSESSSSVEMSIQDALARIAVLEAENRDLRERLTKSEEERKEADMRVGMALSALHMEKEEKMRLLPPPRKSFFQTMKEVFSNKNSKNDGGQTNFQA